MNNSAPFTIYDAAAGSGKTFTLVREYLSFILGSEKPNYYQHLLALTFTNKAVAEMKERIIENLMEFSEVDTLKQTPQMMLAVSDAVDQDITTLQKRAKKTLTHLLHNYAAFSVETIDRFNHRLIRTFARDLSLPTNFEVVLDTESLLVEAIDTLISKTGDDEAITKVLVDFTLEKADDDKSWDISRDILKTSKLLNNENDATHVAKLKDKTLADFAILIKELYAKKKTLEKAIIDESKNLLALLDANGLEQASFSGGYFYKHVNKLAAGNLAVNYGAKWQNMTVGSLYTKGTAKNQPQVASTIDGLLDTFIDYFNKTKEAVFQISFIDAVLKNSTPLSVINLVSKEIETIKEEQNLVPISQFNALIQKEIKNQPAPFIYERMGERYQHFFIDEFQDTSVMQWSNLIPLIDNTLSQSQQKTEGSLLLVGDVKQSIYRWRGGNPEQFLQLINGVTPFHSSEANVENLPKNYRSLDEIVTFNNSFFSYASSLFGDALHEKLYLDGNKQTTNNSAGGYVNLTFIEADNKEEREAEYAQLTLKTINNLVENGFQLSDICVLTRRKVDGIALSTFLMENNVDVISAETLLLQYSPIVKGLLNALSLSFQPTNNEIKVALLDFLHEHFKIEEDKHTFFTQFIIKSSATFTQILKTYGIDFEIERLPQLSIYQTMEYCIKAFDIDANADAYVFSFMDLVYEYSQQPRADLLGFLEHWEKKSGSASISTGEGINGVQFMTVHKAKGLEFPVVIFPYADVDLYREIEPKTWMHLPQGFSEKFDEVLINYGNAVADYGEQGAHIYQQRRNTLELDMLNILYVTLTRPVEQLYIFADKAKSGEVKTYNQLFKGFLENEGKYKEEVREYIFGNFSEKIKVSQKEPLASVDSKYISSTPEAHNLHIITKESQLHNTTQSQAILEGNLFHDTMELIRYKGDEHAVFERYRNQKNNTESTIEQLEQTVSQVMNHNDLKHLFTTDTRVVNERDIITAGGYLLRPDRLNIDEQNNSVVILDYKTGTPDYSHEDQINGYAIALSEMGYTIAEKLLVYTSNDALQLIKVA